MVWDFFAFIFKEPSTLLQKNAVKILE